MATVKELMAELEARKAEKKAELAEMVETIKIKHEMAKLDSPLFNARELTKQDSMSLDVLLNHVEEQYSREDRKIAQTFGYGIIPNKIITLLKAIQFSKAEDKEELLMMTGLDAQIVEDTLDAFGNTAYFSKINVEVVGSIPMDIPRVKDLLNVVCVDMRLVSDVDYNKFNDANVGYQYTRAQLKAEELEANTKEFLTEAIAYNE